MHTRHALRHLSDLLAWACQSVPFRLTRVPSVDAPRDSLISSRFRLFLGLRWFAYYRDTLLSCDGSKSHPHNFRSRAAAEFALNRLKQLHVVGRETNTLRRYRHAQRLTESNDVVEFFYVVRAF
jgi:hypothetical protein